MISTKKNSSSSFKYFVLSEQVPFNRLLSSLVSLAIEITKADLKSRQFQRFLGPLWWIIEPSVMSIAYFAMTTALDYSSGNNHFMFIFIATTVWKAFVRPIESSLLAYVGFGGIIRQSNFPLISVNISHLLTEFIFFGIGLVTVFILGLVFSLPFNFVTLGIIPLIICQGLITFACMISFACIGVYLRDLQGLTALFFNAFFILSPSIYEPDKLPEIAQKISVINPFYYLFPAYREVLIHGQLPDLVPCLIWSTIGFLGILASLKLYVRVRPNFLRVL